MIFNLDTQRYLARAPRTALRWGERTRGMIGRRFSPEMDAMVFPHCGAIHTFFMRMRLDVVFLNRESRVVGLHENLGIQRNAETLSAAAHTVRELRRELDGLRASSLGEAAELIHLRHMLLLADMQISASELRRESRGVFYRSDFPDMDDPNWRKNILIKNTGGRMQLSFRDAVRCVDCQVSER